MILTFLGADHEVTGSCHYLQVGNKKAIVDCGMEQGKDIYENQELPVAAGDIDYIFLTHAHIDHSGLIPLMVKKGFRGQVFATKASCQLCNIMLRDSAHIQEFEAEWKNRKAKRAGQLPYEPIYSMEDAVAACELLVPVDYDKTVSVCDEFQIKFVDAGHLLGSASIEVKVTEGDISKTIIFSGDIGNINKPIIKDPKIMDGADYVLIESTYGDRFHGERPDYVNKIATVLNDTFAKGGNVVIPSFAVGRTQEMLYFLRIIKKEKMVKNYPNFEVYVDSPLAIEATNIFNKNVTECFDDETKELINKGINPLQFEGLKLSVSSNESIAINQNKVPKVILSASGMCEAGRIRHHLKHNLWRPECTIVFVGYQAVGTTGRIIIDGAEEIKLFGEPIQIKAEIVQLQGSSGHADKDGLLRWINAFEKKPKKVFVVHGEDSVCEEFTECLKKEYGYDAMAPYTGGSYDLIADRVISEGVKERKTRRTTSTQRGKTVFDRLVAAGKRLMTVITHNEGGTNKDLAKFTDQINALCDKWDR